MEFILKMLIPITYLLNMNIFFTKRSIIVLTNNIVERLKISSMEVLFDKWIYKSNPINANFDYLPFDGDEIIITRRKIYHINDDIIERLNNSLIIDVYTIWL